VIVLYRDFMIPSSEIMKSAKKSRAPETGAPVLVRFQPKPLETIDEWRRKQPDLPSRAEAIRRLVDQALKGKR
jgi:hypothetical protein